MKRILLIEDNDDIRSNTAEILELSNYKVIVAENGKIGIEKAIEHKPDLIICDVLMPEMDGHEVLHLLLATAQTHLIPFVFSTSMSEQVDRKEALSLGADDYIIKPFDFRELLVRIRALLKRIHNTTATGLQLTAGDLIMNLDTKEVTRENIPIQLTAKEFQLLEYFLRNQNSILSRADIALNVWDIDFDSGTNVIDVYVNYLRKKIDKNFGTPLIHTQVGMGYILKDKNQ